MWVIERSTERTHHFAVFGQEHFDHIVSEYVTYYHDLRPHQGVGNVLLPRPRGEPSEVPGGDGTPPLRDLAEVKRGQRLGGLLKHFYRNAA